MKAAVDALAIAQLVAFVSLGAVAFERWRTRRGEARAWLAVTFVILAVVVVAGRVLPASPDRPALIWAQKALIAVLVMFPFCLYRFAATFRRPPSLIEALARILTAATVVGTFLLSSFPKPGEGRSTGITVYVFLLLAQWVFLLSVVAVWLWRGGREQAALSRRRMRMLSLGAATMAVTLLVAGAAPAPEHPGILQLVTGILALATGPLFLFGFAPPRLVLAAWRRPAELELRQAEAGLMAALTPAEVAEVLLPHVSHILGSGGALLTGENGEVVGSYGIDAARATELAAEVAADTATHIYPQGTILTLPLQRGWLTVEANAYTPYFGREETEILQNLASLTEVALGRAYLSEREREVTAELQQANEAMREFIAIASHDLRTPITVVKGFAETIRTQWDLLSDGDKLDYLAMIGRQADHLSKLVDDLLTVSRLDAEALRPDPRPVVLRAAVERIVRDLGTDGTGVEVSIDSDLDARVDPEHLVRMVRNYVENARNYGQPPIEVSAARDGAWTVVRVHDHGEGVPDQFQSRLFERFARADGAKAREKRGTGLGLSIVRGLARANGGDAYYEPTGNGACFVLRLPAPTS